MRRAALPALALLGLLCSAAIAQAPDSSIRPLPRGVSIAPVTEQTGQTAQAGGAESSEAQSPKFSLRRLFQNKRPERKPAGGATKRTTQIAASAAGSVCGVPEIKGVAIDPIRGRGGCGIAQPVRLTSVSGVGLSLRPVIDCPTARALNTWVVKGLKPAVGELGGGVKALHVVGHYACRNRNNAKNGRLSEHARGRALDIGTIALKNGRQITVLEGWRRREEGRILKRAHAAACGPFGTVLGPNANKFHRDHFHFDTARYRSGPYCR